MSLTWTLRRSVELEGGTVRWDSFGSPSSQSPSIVLVHGAPYSSFLWREVAPALARHGRQVYVFDHLGYDQSDRHDGQDLTLAAQGRNFAELLTQWNLKRPSVVACDIGGAIVLRALLLEHVGYSDLTLCDAVTGGSWEHGLFGLIRGHHAVFEQPPGYSHEALVTAHLRNGTAQGYRPGVIDVYLARCRRAGGLLSAVPTAQLGRHRRVRAPTGTIDVPVTLL